MEIVLMLLMLPLMMLGGFGLDAVTNDDDDDDNSAEAQMPRDSDLPPII